MRDKLTAVQKTEGFGNAFKSGGGRLEAHGGALENPSVSCMRGSERLAPRGKKGRGRRPSLKPGEGEKLPTSAGTGPEGAT